MTYEQRFDAGVAALRERQLRAAIEFLQGCTAEHPEDPRAHLHLGRALEMAGLDSDAEAAFTRAAELDPRNPDVHGHLGRVWWRQGRLASAKAAFERALAVNPQHAAAREDLVELRFRPGSPPIAAVARVPAPDAARRVKVVGVTAESALRTVGLALLFTGMLVGCGIAAATGDPNDLILYAFALPFTFTWLPWLLARLHDARAGRQGSARLLITPRGDSAGVVLLHGATTASSVGLLAALGAMVTAITFTGLSQLADPFVDDKLRQWGLAVGVAVPACCLFGAAVFVTVWWQVARYNRCALRLGRVRAALHDAGTRIQVSRLPMPTMLAAGYLPLLAVHLAVWTAARPLCYPDPYDRPGWIGSSVAVAAVVLFAQVGLVGSFNLFARRFGGLELTIKEA
ncbi:MAG: tetratricopeptide repeat protein [Armatimonadetes bacterium]|nr:tetratricopeptide repeat protein [Armatimonadota bacterium]